MTPSLELSTTVIDKCQTNESKWDNAIIDAESEIENLAKQQRRLEQAVKIFRANKRDGVPWPGEQQKSPQEGG